MENRNKKGYSITVFCLSSLGNGKLYAIKLLCYVDDVFIIWYCCGDAVRSLWHCILDSLLLEITSPLCICTGYDTVRKEMGKEQPQRRIQY